MTRGLTVAVILLSGCTTQIDLVVESTVETVDLSLVTIEVEPSEVGEIRVSLADTPFPLTLGIRPRAEEDAELAITVRGFVNETDLDAYVTVAETVRFSPGETTRVRLVLRDRCSSAEPCPSGQRCVDGLCVLETEDAGVPDAAVDAAPRDAAGPEICDGFDNDGDGDVDEEDTCTPGHPTAAGDEHGCRIVAGPQIECWGLNRDGQLGNGTRTPTGAPTPVASGDRFVETNAGSNFTCATLTDGRVACWGNNAHGQLGSDVSSDDSTPQILTGLADAARIAAGGEFACSVQRDRTVRCWGRNDVGQLGHMGSDIAPAFDLGGVDDLSLGRRHACVLLNDRSARCWGDPSDGRLGREVAGAQPVEPEPLGAGTVTIAVAAGGAHSCAITEGSPRRVLCWGDGGPQLGEEDFSLPLARRLALGEDFSCALTENGEVFCWGANDYGQLGTSLIPEIGSTDPLDVSLPMPAVDIVAGRHHACALLEDGRELCWGSDTSGQLGSLADVVVETPTVVSLGLPHEARLVATGDRNTCVSMRPPGAMNASVWCWGEGRVGRLGDGETISRSVPEAANTPPDPLALSAGYHGFGQTIAAGTGWVWGLAQGGRIGVPAPPDYVDRARMIGPASLLTLGEHHGCLATAGRILQCFGSGTLGELGSAATVLLTPTTVNNAPLVVGLAAGYGHTLGIEQGTGQLICFGDNRAGQCGVDPTVATTTDPMNHVMDLRLSPVVPIEMSAGDAHSCVVSSPNGLLCFGADDFGQLGNGAAGATHVPTAVSSFPPVPASFGDISAGAHHTCALQGSSGSTRQVWCWGDNAAGQLGTGDTTSADSRRTAMTGGVAGWDHIAAGVDHTCAIDRDGTVYCWGFDGDGATGSGRALTGDPHPVGTARP